MKNNKFYKLLDNSKFNITISIVIALVFSVSIWLSTNNEVELTIEDVPVDFEYNSNTYKNASLDIVDLEELYIDITVSGLSTTVNKLTQADFIVYVDTNSVTSAGEKQLSLKVSPKNPEATFTIESFSQQTVIVVFEKIASKKFQIETDIANIAVAEEYSLESSNAVPTEVTVTGPETEISKIQSVKAVVETSEELSASAIMSGIPLKLYDKENNEISTQGFTLDTNMVELNINILKRDQLNLKVEFINVPQGVDIETLEYKLSREVLQVAVPTSQYGEITELLWYVDLQQENIDQDIILSLDGKLPEGYANIENIDGITLSFDTSGYESNTVEVDEIKIINVPNDYEIKAAQDTIWVNLYGLPENLQEISGEGIIGEVDASKIQLINGGQLAVPVKVVLPNGANVFVSGEYELYVYIRKIVN